MAAGGLISLFALFKLWGVERIGTVFGRMAKRPAAIDCKPGETKKTIKVLGQDGKLMELDISRGTVVKEKITNEELKTWVHRG